MRHIDQSRLLLPGVLRYYAPLPDTVNKSIQRRRYPPVGYSARSSPFDTHIFTDAEISALLTACADLHPPGGLRGASCATIFGLIAATGLRISEATALTRSDVDLKRGLLHIRHAKFDKSRWVPMHPTTTSALQRYALQRDRDPLTTTEAFFVFDYGRCASTPGLQYAFQLLRQRLKWRSPRRSSSSPNP